MQHLDAFHDGEIAVQERAGERAIGARRGGMVDDRITSRALPFLAEQQTVAIGTLAADGALWASLWLGEPGVVRSDDGAIVTISRDLLRVDPDDPVLAHLRAGGEVGLLAIELTTRRRLRINGVVAALTGDAIDIEVRETFANCPKYIQRRSLRAAPPGPARADTAAGSALDDARRARIVAADTLFVASYHPERGADVSHRGGEPGFVRVPDGHTLRIPDYPGNSMFKTLGNLEADGRAGVAVADFAGGRLLSLTGRARLCFGDEDPSHPTGGTGRYWELSVERWVEHAMPATYRWQAAEASPFNPPAFG